MDKRNLFFTCKKGFLSNSCCQGANKCPHILEIDGFTVSDNPLWITKADQVLRLYIKSNYNRYIPIREIIDTFGFAPSNEFHDISAITNLLIQNEE